MVPGNSAYWYEFTVPATAREDISKSWTIEPANAKVLYKRTEMDAVTGLITSFLALVQFPNKALDATLTLANWQKGVASEDTLTVHVVQVFVSDPANGSFKPSQALKGGTQKGWNAAKVTFTAPQLVPNQDVHTMVISSSPGNAPNALSWYADVTLNCPDGNKYLNSIQVGFHQIAKLQAFRTLDATTYVNTSVEDHTYLDSTAPGTSKPWYSADVPGFRGIIGGADMASGVPKTINGADSPAWVAVVEYGAGHFRAKEARLTSAFQLSVAASTSDNGGWDANNIFSPNIVAPQPNINLPEMVLFPEASAAWSVNANGTISINNSSTLATWTPDNTTAGVKPPQGNVWVVDIAPPKFPDGLVTRGQLANDAAAQKNVTYAHYSLQ